MRKPLEGVRVVELSTFVAAPVCGRLLRDLGAEVIKIEAASGDMWRETVRMYVPEVYNEDHNPIYDLYNTGKQHISLNLKTKEGMEAMHKLLEKADVAIWRAGAPSVALTIMPRRICPIWWIPRD